MLNTAFFQPRNLIVIAALALLAVATAKRVIKHPATGNAAGGASPSNMQPTA